LVHTALAAAKKLSDAGIEACVVDAYSLPLETTSVLHLAENHGHKILVIEDNYVGGLCAEIAEAAAKTGKVLVESMAVKNLPKSGKTPEDVLAYCHLAESDIIAAALKFVG
ncbi:MAG: transketolase C-terminal domain-containing protein, partial [Phycisphaerae bacterium]